MEYRCLICGKSFCSDYYFRNHICEDSESSYSYGLDEETIVYEDSKSSSEEEEFNGETISDEESEISFEELENPRRSERIKNTYISSQVRKNLTYNDYVCLKFEYLASKGEPRNMQLGLKCLMSHINETEKRELLEYFRNYRNEEVNRILHL